jgi:hypothetical protein
LVSKDSNILYSCKKFLKYFLPCRQFLLVFVATISLNPYMPPVSKKRIIKSLENLSEDLKNIIRDQYPNGYESSITRITNAKKEPIFVFPLETEDAVILVKVPVTKNSDGEYDVESTPVPDPDAAGSDADDDFATPAATDDDDSDGSFSGRDDYDEEGGGRKSREASYDPDFDN